MAVDASPVVDEADEDKDDDHNDLDHGEPVFGFACLGVRRLYCRPATEGRTVDADMDELDDEYGRDEDQGPLPWRNLRVPVL